MDKQKKCEAKKRGRPAWNPDLKKTRSLAALGLNMLQISRALGISEATLYEKQAKFPEFSEAIKRGHAEGVAKVADKLMKKIGAMDTTAIIFWLKCNAGWREYKLPKCEKIDLEKLTDEQLQELVAKYEAVYE